MKKNEITRTGWFIFFGILSFIITVMITVGATKQYGYALYIGVPLTIGYLVGFALPPSFGTRWWIVPVTVLVLCILLFIAGIEGGICLLMILAPLFIAVAIGYITGRILRRVVTKNVVPVLVFLMVNPACIVADTQVEMNNHSVSTPMLIHASAGKVWQKLTNYVSYGTSDNFFFRNGVNYPQSMCILCRHDSTLLHCQLRNGATDLHITELVPGKRMRFELTQHVVPMKELSLYHDLNTPHTHADYFTLKYGQFELQPVDSNNCKVVATSEFAYRLYPAFYWNMWSDYIVNRMHLHVLHTIKQMAENSTATPDAH